jgi:hypothetical protein
MRLRLLALLALAAPLAGCPNTDTAVFVDPTITAPAATVSGSALGTAITGGSFHLNLHLGARASGPSTVTLGAFSITDASKTNTIVSALDVATSTTFPATVEPDSDVDADFTFETGSKLLAGELKDKLCDPAGVVIHGTIDDALLGTSTPMDSPVFMPTCM